MLHTDLLKTPYSITSDIRLYIRRQKNGILDPTKDDKLTPIASIRCKKSGCEKIRHNPWVGKGQDLR